MQMLEYHSWAWHQALFAHSLSNASPRMAAHHLSHTPRITQRASHSHVWPCYNVDRSFDRVFDSFFDR